MITNLISAAVNWTKTRANRLIAKWNSDERRSARRHAKRSSEEWCELSDEIFALFVLYKHHDKPFGLGGGGRTDEADL
jgi:hypothetical protein